MKLQTLWSLKSARVKSKIKKKKKKLWEKNSNLLMNVIGYRVTFFQRKTCVALILLFVKLLEKQIHRKIQKTFF